MREKSFSVTLTDDKGQELTLVENHVYNVRTVLTKYKDATITSQRNGLTFTSYDVCGRRLGFVDENDMGFWICIADIVSAEECEQDG